VEGKNRNYDYFFAHTFPEFDWMDGGKCRLISVKIVGTLAPTRMSDQVVTLPTFIREMC
jgi:hypothetical protein